FYCVRDIADRSGMAHDRNAVRVPDLQLRTAFRASIGLSMKSPVMGIFVFPSAQLAHYKPPHRGIWPVVGKTVNDRKAWATICAVRERVTISAVRRIEDFPQAIRACRDVR